MPVTHEIGLQFVQFLLPSLTEPEAEKAPMTVTHSNEHTKMPQPLIQDVKAAVRDFPPTSLYTTRLVRKIFALRMS